MKDGAVVWRAGQPAPRWTWNSLGLAVLCTLAFFLAVPLLETVRTLAPTRQQEVRSLPLRPEPPAPPPRMSLPQPPRPEPVQPELALPAPPAFDLPAPPLNAPSLQAPSFPFSVGPSPVVPQLSWQVAVPELPSVFELDQIDQPPRARSQMRPVYPTRARLQRIEGWVTLEFVVEVDGSVRDLTVTERVPDDTFVDAALRAAERWTFDPGQDQGQPVPVRVRQKVTFQLQ